MGKERTWLQRARKLLGRARRRFGVDVYDVFIRSTREASFVPPAGYEFRFGTPLDLAACDPYHTELDERERGLGADRLTAGHRLIVGLFRGVVVSTMWVNPRYLNVPGIVKRCLGRDQWFIYKAFTSPDHRGRQLYQAGMRFVLAEMAKQELKELVGYAHEKKRVSRAGLSRLEFTPAGRMYDARLGSWRHTFLSPVLTRAFPRAVSRKRPIQLERREAA